MISPSGKRPRIRLRFAEVEQANLEQGYRVAGCELWANRPLEELSPFALEAPTAPPAHIDLPSPRFDHGELPLVYEGRGWVGGREVAVAARAAEGWHGVELEDGTRISVFEHAGDVLVWVTRGADPEAERFGALGPGLALALALVDYFSLHAGAIAIGGRAVVLMGESGAGKSTMARLASGRAGCRRLADDIVPIRESPEGELRLAPRFPQLKLNREEQWQGAEELPCDELIAIRREPEIRSAEFSVLSRRDSVLALLESTVASRLFSKRLQTRELDLWTGVAGAHRVIEWSVPDDARRVVESFASLEARLARSAKLP